MDDRVIALEIKLERMEKTLEKIDGKVDELQRANDRLKAGGTIMLSVAATVGGAVVWLLDHFTFTWR